MLDVVIPVLNQSDLTWRCVTHVFSFPADDMRVVLVDDGSVDDTPLIGEFLERRGHLYLRHEANKGPHAAWNTGWRASRGGRVCFLNNDVAVFGSTLELLDGVQAPYVCAHEVIGKWHPAEMAAYVDGLQYLSTNTLEPGYCHSCFAVDRGLLDRLDGFDESLKLVYGDTDFMLRAKDAGVEPQILRSAGVFHGVSVTRRRALGLERDVDQHLLDRERFEAKWAHRPDVLEAHPRQARYQMVDDRKSAWWEGEDA